MKVVNVQGRKKTGKTTTVTNIITELCRRGYSVGSVKSIHIDGFTMDSDNADTGKHKAAGADPVTARCHGETNVMFKDKMNLREILRHYDNDWVVIESHVDLKCPNIITGCTAEYGGEEKDESLAAQINELTIACSGVIANELQEFRNLPVVDARTEVKRLVDIIEESYEKSGYEYVDSGRASLTGTDWNQLWKSGRKAEAESGSSEYWDGRAASFRKKGEATYTELFYGYMNAKPGDTLFDMGCGSGTLAIPFAKKGHEVWAADFSQEMLNCMMADAESEGVAHMIHPIQLDWAEDWSLRDLPKCDIAFASRSMFFDKLTESLNKLESVASRCCCLGAWDGPGEGLSSCYVAMGELMSRDKRPELRYIEYPFHSDRRGLDFTACTGFIRWNI